MDSLGSTYHQNSASRQSSLHTKSIFHRSWSLGPRITSIKYFASVSDPFKILRLSSHHEVLTVHGRLLRLPHHVFQSAVVLLLPVAQLSASRTACRSISRAFSSSTSGGNPKTPLSITCALLTPVKMTFLMLVAWFAVFSPLWGWAHLDQLKVWRSRKQILFIIPFASGPKIIRHQPAAMHSEGLVNVISPNTDQSFHFAALRWVPFFPNTKQSSLRMSPAWDSLTFSASSGFNVPLHRVHP